MAVTNAWRVACIVWSVAVTSGGDEWRVACDVWRVILTTRV